MTISEAARLLSHATEIHPAYATTRLTFAQGQQMIATLIETMKSYERMGYGEAMLDGIAEGEAAEIVNGMFNAA